MSKDRNDVASKLADGAKTPQLVPYDPDAKKAAPEDDHSHGNNSRSEEEGKEKRFRDFPPPTPARELQELHPEPPVALIEGLIGEGDKLILSAPSKIGKTWNCLSLAAAVAQGGDWFDFRCKQGNVLFLNFELQPAWIACRIRKMEEAGLSFANVDIKNLRGCFPEWDELQWNIQKWCESNRYKMIILDPIYKMLGAVDENKNAEVAAMMNQIDRIAAENGAGIMFSHHFPKGNRGEVSSIDRASGAGVFARDPDAILTLTPHEEEDCFTLEAHLRNYPRVEPSTWEFAWPLFERRDDLDPSKLKSKGGAQKKGGNEDVLACFDSPAKPLTYAELRERVIDRLGCSTRTAERRIKETLKMLDNSNGLYLPAEQ